MKKTDDQPWAHGPDKRIAAYRAWRTKPIAPEVRAEAMEILRTKKGYRRFIQVAKLLGWPGSGVMPFTEMAKALGLTLGKFHYLIDRDAIGARQKRQRAAKKEASNVPLQRLACRELRFTIELPHNWRTDYIPAPYPPERQFLYELQYHAWKLMEELREGWGTDGPQSDQLAAERNLQLNDMRVGLFRTWPANCRDTIGLTVTRLNLDEPLTSLELYQSAKPHWRTVGWAYRMPRGIEVDGIQAICYQYESLGTAGNADMPMFIDIYFAEREEGWIISCSCKAGKERRTFEQYRPLFQRIARSLRRIHTV